MLLPDLSLPLIMLYAEIHYRFFPLFPSILYKKEPEIIFDAPARISAGNDLPIFLIINDINRFPCTPKTVAVTISQPGYGIQRFDFTADSTFLIQHSLEKVQSAYLFPLPKTALPYGEFFINAAVTVQIGKKTTVILNDNIPGSSRRSFRCFRADTPLPGSTLCDYGDLHVHSHFSQSHVEFGAPLTVIDTMAACYGLHVVGITDHSYDLACRIDNYLEEDRSVTRWQRFIGEINVNKFSTIMIPGEEISCANSEGETVHCIGLGLNSFIPGSSDGARRKRVFNEQLTIHQVVDAIVSQSGIIVAAHPQSKTGLLQQLFLHRGNWALKDFSPSIHGIQPLNSGFSTSWDKGKSLWIKLLQQGLAIPLLAGNDAHGDFSRYRAIKTPFCSVYENFQRYMGYAKTGIYGKHTTYKEILSAIRNNATFITTGPYLSINNSASCESCYAVAQPDEKVVSATLYCYIKSTPEFGRIKRVTVLFGKTETTETILLARDFHNCTYEENLPFNLPATIVPGYLRTEAETITFDGTVNRAFTSALFFS